MFHITLNVQTNDILPQNETYDTLHIELEDECLDTIQLEFASKFKINRDVKIITISGNKAQYKRVRSFIGFYYTQLSSSIIKSLFGQLLPTLEEIHINNLEFDLNLLSNCLFTNIRTTFMNCLCRNKLSVTMKCNVPKLELFDISHTFIFPANETDYLSIVHRLIVFSNVHIIRAIKINNLIEYFDSFIDKRLFNDFDKKIHKDIVSKRNIILNFSQTCAEDFYSMSYRFKQLMMNKYLILTTNDCHNSKNMFILQQLANKDGCKIYLDDENISDKNRLEQKVIEYFEKI